ncbi:MAG: hydrolase 1, exosortase A system-associated [Pseudomonadota bacterium]
MSRLHLSFACGSLTLAGTLDTAPGKTGLLIVSGGNDPRAGAFSGQARLANAVARTGFPVFRFDRRGVGDSEGENRGFRKSSRDIASAREALLALAPDVERVVAFGNCDAASALMLTGGEGFDGLILSNPWTLEEAADETATLPPSAVRERYAAKLKNPREIGRLLSGGVNLKKLARGLIQATASEDSSTGGLADEMRAGLEGFDGWVSILLASADRTAQAFAQRWPSDDDRVQNCEGAGHAFVEPDHRAWLEKRILEGLRAQR